MTRATDLRAEQFHKTNPLVMEELRTIALRSARLGRKRLSIAELFEQFRHHNQMKTEGDVFRVNNSHRAWYARQLMATTPELAGLFAIRGGASVGIADGVVATLDSTSPYADDEYEAAA